MKKPIEAPRDGAVLEFKWTTSRARDTYGYNICTLRVDGRKVSACNGGGYDMKGTSLGHWVAHAFRVQLLKLKPAQMPEQSHWQPDNMRVCAGECKEKAYQAFLDATAECQTADEVREKKINFELPLLPDGTWECPTCGGRTHLALETFPTSTGGKRIDDGRYFPGLYFHDPDYDPGKAVIGKDCSDRTLSKESHVGQTVDEAEAAGVSFGLERLQAQYSASSRFATKRHRIPEIDGACGFSSVEKILNAVGYGLEYVKGGNRDDIYILRRLPRKRHGNTGRIAA